MPTLTSTLSSKGQLVVPAPIRAALGIRSGDKLTLRVEGTNIVITKAAPGSAELIRSKRVGRRVLKAPAGAPPMTSAAVSALADELP
ncbi:MAG: AbrB/MazE/SpoVT family DNA-binding domain-containing protein [Deltaproteobacteria bacterium]|nr:AbrB/MazE/SpoVT family DNA-binding domain-containing protein [Deltaproteobacteria bacterium]